MGDRIEPKRTASDDTTKAEVDNGVGDVSFGASRAQLRKYHWAFYLTNFGIGPAFSSHIIYMSFQIQQNAFWSVGHHPGQPPRTGCPNLGQPCRVPLGTSDVNLTSLLLYINAIGFGVGGFVTLFVCAWGDHMRLKREQYILLVCMYGALCLPAAGLTAYNISNYYGLISLYIIFAVVGYLVIAWGNIFVPYAMQAAAPIEDLPARARLDALNSIDGDERRALRARREEEGLKISVGGSVSLNIAMVLFSVITIGISYATMDARKNAGMYMTTVSGVVCILCALAGWRFLPSPQPTAHNGNWWLLPFTVFGSLWKGISRYTNAMLFLFAYAIYNDSHFAFSAVIGQLFNLNIRPSIREYTAYSVAGSITSVIGSVAFMYVFPHSRLSLRQWAMVAFGLAIFTAFWCCLGMSKHVAIGFKHRAEFYVFQVVMSLAGAILNPLYRVLFPQMFPKGNEIQYFGFQLVLSCATAWIPQVVNGPIVDKTNNQRLPAAIALAFFFVSLGLTWWCDDVGGVSIIHKEEVEALEKEAAVVERAIPSA
ncbi:hypothetical protein Q8F55_001622 [Vanrija albida]|uniref:Autophagy-related protein n=1 Tax=Vanrija albida TaxID=181172 RepID=A0ABR3QHD0_9TREE